MTPFTGSAPETEEWRHFDFVVAEGIGTITLRRPDKLNALTFEVYADLRDLLQEMPRKTEVRVLVITGEGRGFCSGGDVHEIIGELLKMGASGRLEFTRMTGEVVRLMRDCPVPIIAAVNGMAAGAGAVIALASDLRILAESASVAFLFTKVGLAGADMGSAYLLPRLVGLSKASELLLLGDTIDAATAARLGLTYRVVADADLDAATADLATRLARGPALAYASTKALITRELDMDLSASLELDATTQALLMGSDDHAEFYAAFVEGRSPRWSGR